MTFSINVTLDGCVDHQEGIADNETHAFFTRLMDECGAMLWGRVTYEMMESYWPAVARGDVKAPPALRDWAVKLEAKPKYVVSSIRTDFPWNNSHHITVLTFLRSAGRRLPDGNSPKRGSSMKTALTVALGLACAVSAVAVPVELSGNVYTVVDRYSLRGVKVVLANARLEAKDTTNFSGAWTLKGEVVGIGRHRVRSPASRSEGVVVLEEGRLSLGYQGRNAGGRATFPARQDGISREAGPEFVASRGAADSVVVDTLLYWYKGSLIARAPITSYSRSGIVQLVDTAGLRFIPSAPGPAGVAHTNPIGFERASRLATGMRYIQSRNRTFKMGLKDSLVPNDALALRPQTVTFTYDFLIDSVEVGATAFTDMMTWALEQGRIVLNTAESGNRWVTTAAGHYLFNVVPITGAGSTLPINYSTSKKMFQSTGFGGVPIEGNFRCAILYANWLSERSGIEPVYDTATFKADFTKNGYRLPTEAEWEYAARGGAATDYPWGDEWDLDQAMRVMNTKSERWPVAFLRPNSYGLYDMLGNAGEFVGDLYAPYATTPVIDPMGGTTGTERIVRGLGGSEYNGRFGYRQKSVVRDNQSIGFRLVLPLR